MNKYTDAEIINKVQEIWHEIPDFAYDPKITVTQTDSYVRIKLEAMYSQPGLSFAHMKRLADYFGTDNINDDDRFSEDGCETCDYGSSYGFTLTIRPTK